jgi:hypothetical protein
MMRLRSDETFSAKLCIKCKVTVYKKSADGWVLHKSSYKKLRIGVTWLKEQLTTQGMYIGYEGTEKGFTVLIAAMQ